MDLGFLQECLQYDRDAGVFYWRRRPESHFASSRAANSWNTKYAETKAGTAAPDGRVNIQLSYRLIKAHRLVWFFEKGQWPSRQIDHINGDPSDNRVGNLREATNAQNQYNRGANKNNTSGYKGVYWDKPRKKWRAQIMHNKKTVFLGHFNNTQEAAAAYAEAANQYANEFARSE